MYQPWSFLQLSCLPADCDKPEVEAIEDAVEQIVFHIKEELNPGSMTGLARYYIEVAQAQQPN